MNISPQNLKKLEDLKNLKVMKMIKQFYEIMEPDEILVFTDSEEDRKFIRELALKNNEEAELSLKGHTFHFDGMNDQGRDKEVTKVLLPEGKTLSHVNTMNREQGIKEITEIMNGVMKGKKMLVKFSCLGPTNSKFSISAMQITDSAYVLHSEDLLYRAGYEQFKQLKNKEDFFYFVHSAGELENNTSKNTKNKRIYIDLEEERVLSVNNQYAGNSVGLKKLALRLAISKANKEDWLCEHMFVMGVKNKGRKTFFTGAFPSACGKTSTAMIPGNTIVGDDIAYIRPGEDGKAYAVNIESGIFGIIQDVNPKDDPVIYNALTTPRELIFSNILVKNKVPYWLNMGKELPSSGINFSGEWTEGKTDKDGNPIPPAHKNARYTMRLSELENADENIENPDGVPVAGFIYGGRDSDTNVPVFQSLSWEHGVFVGSCLESETTFAILGKEGQRTHDPMANKDFLMIPLGVYIQNHLDFGNDVEKKPVVFATNYFLKEDGMFLNSKLDKKIWLLWMEERVHNEISAIETPIGFIPKYEDLQRLFKEHLHRDYTEEEYDRQFTIRIPRLIERFDRIEMIYRKEPNVPEFFFKHIDEQRKKLLAARDEFSKEFIHPREFEI